jgi:ubiquinone/menaquinone biosynthesis C-methylase UbiE
MGRKRRQVQITDDAAWVFNRMAEVYDARPPYPSELLGELVALAGPMGARVLDIGAGIGHVALPLAQRGLSVTAIEPARVMLEKLRGSAVEQGIELRSFHASAEALPFDAACFELVIIADALHFIDAELAAAQLRRVLVRGGALVIVTCDYADTPFMHAIRTIVDGVADRRPRKTGQAIRHLASLSNTRLSPPKHFVDATPVDLATLERILRSVSFVGPALNAARFDKLRERLQGVTHAPVWARAFTLYCARRP